LGWGHSWTRFHSAIGARADIDAKIAAGEAAAASADALAKEIGDTAGALDKALTPETKPRRASPRGPSRAGKTVRLAEQHALRHA
jgi:hypothetical protein